MNVYPCGTKVTANKMEGIITQISIRFECVLYEFSYFLNGEHNSCWLNECEFETMSEKQSIGFQK